MDAAEKVDIAPHPIASEKMGVTQGVVEQWNIEEVSPQRDQTVTRIGQRLSGGDTAWAFR